LKQQQLFVGASSRLLDVPCKYDEGVPRGHPMLSKRRSCTPRYVLHRDGFLPLPRTKINVELLFDEANELTVVHFRDLRYEELDEMKDRISVLYRKYCIVIGMKRNVKELLL